MSLKNYLSPLFKYWWLILAAAAVAIIASFMVMRQQPPIYRAQTTLLVGRAMFEANPGSNDIWLGQQLAGYYADIARRAEVRNATMQALGLTRLPEYVVSPLPNSQLMEIVVNDSNPLRAQAVANEVANQLIQRSPTSGQQQGSERQTFIDEQITYLEGKIRETLDEISEAERMLTEMNSAREISNAQNEVNALQTKLAQLQNNYASLIANTEQGAINTLSVIEEASVPTTPVGPNIFMVVFLAAMVAMAIATAAAYLLEFLDDSVKSAEEVGNLIPAPVLANIPLILKGDEDLPAPTSPFQAISKRLDFRHKPTSANNGAEKDGIFIYASNYPRSTVAEEFRSLRINLDFTGIDKPLKRILITSPSPAEGKTSVATNLAIVMAQAGKKVILIDADFRKPSVNIHFNIPNKSGLSDIFRDNNDLQAVVQHWKEKILWIITTGATPPNPADLLSSQRMDQILEELDKLSDVVIIDGPPLMFPDSLALSTKVDGVLMVLRHSFTRRGTVQDGYKQLKQVGARVLGVAINKSPTRRTAYYRGYSYYRDQMKESKVEVETKQLN